MGRWLLVAERRGVNLGPVRHATSRSVTPRPLKALGMAAVRVATDHPLVPHFADEETRIKAYEEQADGSTVLQFLGQLTSFEEVHGEEGDGVVVGFTAPGWDFGDKLLGRSRAGWSRGTAAVPIDRGEIMAQALDTTNADRATGVIRGTIGASSKSYVEKAIFKPVAEVWAEQSGPLDGPDWEIQPLEPAENGGAIAKLNTAAAFGTYKPHAVFEHGVGRANVKSWRRVVDPKTVARRAWHLPIGFPDNTSGEPVSYEDTPAITARGLREIIASADITTLALRTQLVQEHVLVRRYPRQIIRFTPAMEYVDGLRYRVDYTEGDVVPFHALQRYSVWDGSGTYQTGYAEQDLVDILVRIRAVTFVLNDNGDATPVFTTTDEDVAT